MFKTWHWEITTQCNLSCSHCLLGNEKLSNPAWKLQRYFEALDKIKSLGGQNILFTGGEPFYLKNFLIIADYAKALGFSASVITNGTLLNENNVEMTSRLFNVVGISIDGRNDEHDLIRGRGSYRKAIQSIINLLKLKTQVVVYITVNGLNINSQKQMIEELIALGVRSFHFNQLNIQGNAIVNKQLHLVYEQDKIKKRLFQQINTLVDVDANIAWDNKCSIDPDVVYMSHQGHIFSCVEIATRNPLNNIASIDDIDTSKSWHDYCSTIVKPGKCRYTTFIDDGIVIQLNCGECLLIKESGVVT